MEKGPTIKCDNVITVKVQVLNHFSDSTRVENIQKRASKGDNLIFRVNDVHQQHTTWCDSFMNAIELSFSANETNFFASRLKSKKILTLFQVDIQGCSEGLFFDIWDFDGLDFDVLFHQKHIFSQERM